mgnify:CR=1 FL=1
MPIFYVQYQAIPKPESDDFNKCGGAYVNCWVSAGSETQANEIARKSIEEIQWQVVAVDEECREVYEQYYSENTEGLEHYRQAVLDGEYYVYHQWTNEAQDQDALH